MKKSSLLFGASVAVMLTFGASSASADITINGSDQTVSLDATHTNVTFLTDDTLNIDSSADLTVNNNITTSANDQGVINMTDSADLILNGNLGASGSALREFDTDDSANITVHKGTGNFYVDGLYLDVQGAGSYFTSTGGIIEVADGNASDYDFSLTGLANLTNTDVRLDYDIQVDDAETTLNLLGNTIIQNEAQNALFGVDMLADLNLSVQDTAQVGGISVASGTTLTLNDVDAGATMGAITGTGTAAVVVDGDVTLDAGISGLGSLTVNTNDTLATGTQSVETDTLDLNGTLTSTGGTITAQGGAGVNDFLLSGTLNLTNTTVTTDDDVLVDGDSSLTMAGTSSIGDIIIENGDLLVLNGIASTASLGAIDGNTDNDGTIQTQGVVVLDNDIGSTTKVNAVAVTSGTLTTGTNSITANALDVNAGLTSTGGTLNIQGGPAVNDFTIAGTVDLDDTTITTDSIILVDGVSAITLSGTTENLRGFQVDADTDLILEDTASSGALTVGNGDELNIVSVDQTATLGTIDGVSSGVGDVVINGTFDLDNGIGATNRVNSVEIAGTIGSTDRSILSDSLDITGSYTGVNGTLDIKGGAAANDFTIDGTLDLTDMSVVLDANMLLNGASTVTLAGTTDINRGITVEEDSTLNLEDTADSGTITLGTGNVLTIDAEDTATLGTINGAGTADFISSFTLDNIIGDSVRTDVVEITGASTTLTAGAAITSNTVNFDGDGDLVVVDDDVTASATTNVAGEGNISMTGTGEFIGPIGVSGTQLNSVTYSGGDSYDFGTTYAETVTVNSASTVNLLSDTTFGDNTTTTLTGAAVAELDDFVLTTDGNLNISGASELSSMINSTTDYGNIVTTGDATISADTLVDLSFDETFEKDLTQGMQYTIVDGTAGDGVATLTDGNITDTDRFDPVSTLQTGVESILFKLTQVADDDNLILAIEADTDFDTYSAGSYAAATGTSLQADVEQDGFTDTMRDFIETIAVMSQADQLEAMKRLTPETNGARVMAILDANDRISSLIKDRMAGYSSGDPMVQNYGVWGDFFAGTADQDPRDGFDGYETDHYGFTFGADNAISDYSELGLAFTYLETEIDGTESSSGDYTEVNHYALSGYGSHDFEDLTVEGQISIGYSDYDGRRDLTSIGAGTPISTYNGFVYGGRADLKKELVFDNKMTITPLFGLGFYHTRLDDYTETGSVAAVSVDSESYNSLKTKLGAQLDLTDDKISESWSAKPGVHVYWDHEFIDDGFDTTGKFVGGSTGFKTNGMEPDSDTFNAGADLEFSNESDWEITLSYDADIKEDYIGHRGRLRVRKDF